VSKDRPGGARVRHLSGIVNLTIIVEVIKPHFVGKWGANPNFSRRKFSERSQMRVQWGKPIKRKIEVDNAITSAGE
jgi:hypothetical protein